MSTPASSDLPLDVAQAQEALQRAITMGEKRLTYQDAIELCVATRALWVRFYNAWFQNTELNDHAGEFRDLFSKTISILRDGVMSCTFDERQASHVHLMIRNTKVREAGLSIIENSTSRGAAVKEIERIYKIEPEKLDVFHLAAR